jgi:NitT/TauT family transport system substrate-binding protein
MRPLSVTLRVAWSLAVALLAACTAATPAAPTTAPTAAPTARPTAAPTAVSQPAAQPTVASAPAPTLNTSRRVTVKLGSGPPGLNNAGILIAQEKGWFDEQGIDLQVIPFGNAPDIAAPLAAGQLDAGLLGINSGLLNAFARGVKVKFAADEGSSGPGRFDYVSILVRKELIDSGAIKTPADLKGRRIGIVAKGTPSDYGLLNVLKEGGLTLNDVDLTIVPFPNQGPALAAGQIDAAFEIDPWRTQVLDSGTAVVFRRGEQFVPGAQLAALALSDNFAKDTDAATRFMVAYVKSLRRYNDAYVKDDPVAREEVKSIYLKTVPGLPADIYDRMAFPSINPDGRINVASLEDQQKFYLSIGTQEKPVDLQELVDSTFIDGAVKVLGPYQ